MDHFRLAFLLLPLLASAQSDNGIDRSVCQAISVPMCKDMLYNETIIPTLLGHKNQSDAERDLQPFYPFVKENCCPDLKLLLCFYYVPVCTVLESAILPCRSLCERAKWGCEGLMNKFDFAWPESLRCDKFPVSGLCVGELSPATAPPVTTAAPAENQPVVPDHCGPPGAKPEGEDADLQNKAP